MSGPRLTHDVPGLLWTLVRTDFKARYHGSVGGFVWALLKPTTMFLILMAVFSFAFAREQNYRLNLVIGLCLWDFFAEGTKVGIISLHAKGFLVARARFPLSVVVASSIANALLTLVVFATAVIVYIAFARGLPPLHCLLLFFAYLVLYVLVVLGVALGGSVLFLRYRDLNQVWEVVIQAGFFLSPVVYPLDILPERFHLWLYLSPVTPVLQFSRQVLVAGEVPSLRAHAILLGVTAFIFLSGCLLFWRLGRGAAERL